MNRGFIKSNNTVKKGGSELGLPEIRSTQTNQVACKFAFSICYTFFIACRIWALQTNKKLLPVLNTIVVFAIICGCSTIKPSAPEASNQIDLPKPLPTILSIVNIPIRVALKPFITMADKSFEKEFKGAENPCSGLRYNYRVTREPIGVLGIEKTVYLALDVSYGFTGSYCPKCMFENCIIPSIPFSCGWDEPLRRAKIALKSDVDLLSDYHIKSSTAFTSFTPIDPCNVSFANININDLLVRKLTPELAKLATMIDADIGKQDLKPYVSPVWKALQEDIFIPYTGYLRFQPKRMSIGELNMNGPFLYFSVSLLALPAIQSTPWNTPLTVLPKLSPYKKGDGFAVYTDLKLNYDSLSLQLFDVFKNETYALGRDKITITGLRLFPVKDKLGIEVGFSGSKKGIFYLLGVPEFIAPKNQIVLKNIAYDVATKNVLLKTAKWMLDETIRKKLESQMVFDVSDLLLLTKKSIHESLNQTLDGNIKLRGSIKSLEIEGWSLQKDALWVRVKTLGSISVFVN